MCFGGVLQGDWQGTGQWAGAELLVREPPRASVLTCVLTHFILSQLVFPLSGEKKPYALTHQHHLYLSSICLSGVYLSSNRSDGL